MRKGDYVLLLFIFTVTVVLGLLLVMAVGLAFSGERHGRNVYRALDQLKLLRIKGSSIFSVRLRWSYSGFDSRDPAAQKELGAGTSFSDRDLYTTAPCSA